ncbi:MAG: LacI family DNA-binding transcriptional regulator [Acidobacteriaceae bacterium]|jgi:LacI family transcriptional regulator, galactose operon repressor
MAVTMKHIAQALGVSVVTVSKVMRDHSDIGPETRQRVLSKAKELNYRPNLTARSLVTGQSFQVGVIVPTLLHPFFAEVLEALSFTMKQSGYAVIISSSMEDPAAEEAAIEQLIAHRLDGLIVASCSTSPAKFQQLQEQGIPLVLIDRFFPGFKANFVGVDDLEVGRIATQHLIAKGCRRIAHIRGLGFTTGVRRFEGYKLALKQHGLKFDPHLVTPYMTADGRDWQQGFDAMRTLLKGKLPDGIFCYNDPVAVAAVDVTLEAGLRVPEDIAFVGCDNLHFDASLKAPLTSVDHHSSLIGVHAAQMLLGLLGDKDSKAVHEVVLQPSLVVRESSLRRAKAS